MIDTNADPDLIDFPIAANDDAIKSIRLLFRELVDAAVEVQNVVSTEEIEATADAERAKPLETFTMESGEPVVKPEPDTDKPEETKG